VICVLLTQNAPKCICQPDYIGKGAEKGIKNCGSKEEKGWIEEIHPVAESALIPWAKMCEICCNFN